MTIGRASANSCTCIVRGSRSLATASTTPAVLSSALVSRSPLALPPLSPFEQSYYSYQRSIQRAINKPAQSSLEWFFKKGSAGERDFVEEPDKVEQQQLHEDKLDGGARKSLQRKKDRTIYLLLKDSAAKKGSKSPAGGWRFPQTSLQTSESLLTASTRHLSTESPNMDVWALGKAPAGAFVAPSGESTFFLPMKVVRGQYSGKEEFAWLTKEEIEAVVDKGYWEGVKDMLSDR
ncbi:hypothetical protein T439DRAFT_325475 [Meredithblackwellia eburnea MCA 4105]